MSKPASLDYEDLLINLDNIEWNYVCIRTHSGEIIHTKYAQCDSISQDSVILWHPIRLNMIESEDGSSNKAGFTFYEYFSDDVIFYLLKDEIRMISTLSDEWILSYTKLLPKIFGERGESDSPDDLDINSLGGSSTIH